MTKADLVDRVTSLGDLTRRDSEVIVDTLFDSVIHALKSGDKAEARQTLDQLLPREDLTETALQTASEALEKAGLQEDLARVQKRTIKINPLNEQNGYNLAHTLKLLGRKLFEVFFDRFSQLGLPISSEGRILFAPDNFLCRNPLNHQPSSSW